MDSKDVRKEDVLILGGGPAGMSCAMELHTATDKNVTIIEKDKQVGGLAKTLIFKEGDLIFRTDIGPHRFFSKNKYLYDFIENLLDEEWIEVPRQTRQLIEGKFYDYPIKAGQALKNIGLFRGILMGLSYVVAVIQYKVLKKEIVSFEDYIVANFGRKLGEFNMLNYTEKIWGIPCNQIHPDWARQRIKGLNLVSALMNALFEKGKTDAPKSLVDSFYYPQYGTGLIYETIAQKIKESGSEVHTNSMATKIHHKNGHITKVDVDNNGSTESYEPNHVVSSIPITQFLTQLSPSAPADIIEAASRLTWRAQVYLFITLDKDFVTKDNWIYIPNKEIAFGRISEMKNFSKEMSPEGKTSMMIEFFVTEGDEIWNMGKDELFEHVIGDFEKLGLFTRDEVRSCYHLRKSNVYPVYDLDHKEHLDTVKDYLDSFTNLLYIGRPGRFRYNNQDHSLEMGIMAARAIVEGTIPDFELIGGEDEYFEKGYIKDTRGDSEQENT